jgi:DNA-binding GntR family transcriptional regulator
MWQTAIRSSGEIRLLSNAQYFYKCINQYNMHIIRFVITGRLGCKGDSMSGGSSLTQDVYHRLRGDLLACCLMPGQKLKIEELCVRFGAGSSAVREALSRLAADGFVGLEPQRGFRVTPLSFAELRDLTNVRCEIEGLCIRDAIEHGGIDWETNLIAALHRLSKTPERDPQDPQRYNDAFALAHTAFHRAVVGACTSPWLLRIRDQLFAQHERYRWMSGPLASVKRDLEAEHSGIAKAAIDRRADEAVERMTAHLQLTAKVILTSPLLAETPDGAFAGGGGRQARGSADQARARHLALVETADKKS